MTPTTVTPARHRAPTTESRTRLLVANFGAGLVGAWFLIIPFLFVGTLIMAALLAGGGR